MATAFKKPRTEQVIGRDPVCTKDGVAHRADAMPPIIAVFSDPAATDAALTAALQGIDIIFDEILYDLGFNGSRDRIIPVVANTVYVRRLKNVLLTIAANSLHRNIQSGLLYILKGANDAGNTALVNLLVDAYLNPDGGTIAPFLNALKVKEKQRITKK